MVLPLLSQLIPVASPSTLYSRYPVLCVLPCFRRITHCNAHDPRDQANVDPENWPEPQKGCAAQLVLQLKFSPLRLRTLQWLAGPQRKQDAISDAEIALLHVQLLKPQQTHPTPQSRLEQHRSLLFPKALCKKVKDAETITDISSMPRPSVLRAKQGSRPGRLQTSTWSIVKRTKAQRTPKANAYLVR